MEQSEIVSPDSKPIKAQEMRRDAFLQLKVACENKGIVDRNFFELNKPAKDPDTGKELKSVQERTEVAERALMRHIIDQRDSLLVEVLALEDEIPVDLTWEGICQELIAEKVLAKEDFPEENRGIASWSLAVWNEVNNYLDKRGGQRRSESANKLIDKLGIEDLMTDSDFKWFSAGEVFREGKLGSVMADGAMSMKVELWGDDDLNTQSLPRVRELLSQKKWVLTKDNKVINGELLEKLEHWEERFALAAAYRNHKVLGRETFSGKPEGLSERRAFYQQHARLAKQVEEVYLRNDTVGDKWKAVRNLLRESEMTEEHREWWEFVSAREIIGQKVRDEYLENLNGGDEEEKWLLINWLFGFRPHGEVIIRTNAKKGLEVGFTESDFKRSHQNRFTGEMLLEAYMEPRLPVEMFKDAVEVYSEQSLGIAGDHEGAHRRNRLRVPDVRNELAGREKVIKLLDSFEQDGDEAKLWEVIQGYFPNAKDEIIAYKATIKSGRETKKSVQNMLQQKKGFYDWMSQLSENLKKQKNYRPEKIAAMVKVCNRASEVNWKKYGQQVEKWLEIALKEEDDYLLAAAPLEEWEEIFAGSGG